MKDFLKAIPHRPPFLFIDSVDEITETSIRASKKITGEEEFFKGHYPDFSIMPGVLICESVFQAGAILISKLINATESLKDKVPVITRIGNAKFKQMVLPKDILEIEAELVEKVSNAFYMKGSVRVKGKIAVRVEFACTLAPKGAT